MNKKMRAGSFVMRCWLSVVLVGVAAGIPHAAFSSDGGASDALAARIANPPVERVAALAGQSTLEPFPSGPGTGHAQLLSQSARVQFNWDDGMAALHVPEVLNNSGDASGPLSVGLWLEPLSSAAARSQGYWGTKVALPSSCAIVNGGLAGGNACGDFEADSLKLSAVPAGAYQASLVLLEACGSASASPVAQACVDGVAPIASPVQVPAHRTIKLAAGNAVKIVGTVNVNFSFNPATLDVSIQQISNTSTTITTGTLHVEVWFLSSPYTGSGLSGFHGHPKTA